MFAILAVGPLWAIGGHHHRKLNPSVTRRHRADKFGPEKISLVDDAALGSSAWFVDGLPARWRHWGIRPSVITDPADLHWNWWFWPRVQQSRVWFAVSQDHRVSWEASTVKALTQSSTVPVPLRVTAQWVMTLETGRGVMPTMDTEPTGAFLPEMGMATGVTGWMASVGPTPHSLVLTWGLRGPANTGLRLVTLWHWGAQSGWQCTLGVLPSEPTTALTVPFPWDLR